MRITKALHWHVEGEVIDAHPAPLKADPSYVEKMKEDIQVEKEGIRLRKEAKVLKMKEKKVLIRQQMEEKAQASRSQPTSGGCCGGGGCKSEGCGSGSCGCKSDGCGENSCGSLKKAEIGVTSLKEAESAHSDGRRGSQIYLWVAIFCILGGVLMLCL